MRSSKAQRRLDSKNTSLCVSFAPGDDLRMAALASAIPQAHDRSQ
jgi:hypothetical protein